MLNTQDITVRTHTNRTIRAIAHQDNEFPRIDLYLHTGDQKLLIGSVEESVESGLRLIAYTDLSEDGPTATLPIQ